MDMKWIHMHAEDSLETTSKAPSSPYKTIRQNKDPVGPFLLNGSISLIGYCLTLVYIRFKPYMLFGMVVVCRQYMYNKETDMRHQDWVTRGLKFFQVTQSQVR